MDSISLGDGMLQREQQAQTPWRSNLQPSDLRRLDSPSLPMSSATLLDVLTGARVGDRPLSWYRTALYRSYAAPLLLVLMLLLALPSTQAVQRGGQGGGVDRLGQDHDLAGAAAPAGPGRPDRRRRGEPARRLRRDAARRPGLPPCRHRDAGPRGPDVEATMTSTMLENTDASRIAAGLLEARRAAGSPALARRAGRSR